MPTLPTFTVTDPVAQRILKVFENQTDETGAALTPQQAYKRWLRGQLSAYVTNMEAVAASDSLEADLP